MSTSLLLGIHCHQPIDNFDHVIYEAIERSYKPFFNTLKNYPDFKISVHFSGWLLEFIEKNDKELFSLMKSLKDQIEFFTGGYYEPILASIPANDRVGQITKLNNYIKKHFSQIPKGLWLTERVWDNSIIRDIKQCGVEYVIVDDYHLISVGYEEDETCGYFITEDGGESIGIFPINQKLRYAIPFYDLDTTGELIDSFENVQGKNAAIIFDDGEKFGIWPKTYETVYEKKWLEGFFEQTLENKNIDTQTFKEYYTQNKPIGVAYLPTVSYMEMGSWSMDSKNSLKIDSLTTANKELSHFIKGGTWKNFLSKYQESNWIQKRFLELSKKQTSSLKYKDALYKAQCNDVLWHGVFGGVYLPNLRDNAYRYIIECESILEFKKETIDIDLDGYNEYKYKHGNLLSIISPKSGGQIMELDLMDQKFNLQNTLTRYEESYHKKIVIDDGYSEDENISTIHNNKLTLNEPIDITIDWYSKKSAIDHIVQGDITSENFTKNRYKELSDFSNQEFEVKKHTTNRLQLCRDGGIYLDKKYNSSIEKNYRFLNNKIELTLNIETISNEDLNYINEWNLHFANLENLTFNNTILNEENQYITLNTNKLIITDSFTQKLYIFSFDKVVDIFISPICTVSQSEQGLDKTIQGVTFGFLYKFRNKLKSKIEFEQKELENL